jgi:pimeloyl-ACP methyl ester carboxylesterase
MRRLQAALRDSLRACAYDRSGLGWSEAGAGPADGVTAVRELSALVDAAHIQKPFVLVGHSLGANVAQIYAATRATDLKAVVLVDPGTPDDMLEDFSGSDSAAASAVCGWKCSAAWVAGFVGLSRIGAHWAGTKWLTDDENAIYKAALARPRTVEAIVNTVILIPRTAVQTKAARSFGSVPISIFYSEKTRRPSGGETENDVRVWHDKKLDQMRTLLRGTTNGRGPFVVPGATHTSVTFDSAAVRSIAEEVRRLAFLPR